MLTNTYKEEPNMYLTEIFRTLTALSGIAMILLGSAWLKRMLRAYI